MHVVRLTDRLEDAGILRRLRFDSDLGALDAAKQLGQILDIERDLAASAVDERIDLAGRCGGELRSVLARLLQVARPVRLVDLRGCERISTTSVE